MDTKTFEKRETLLSILVLVLATILTYGVLLPKLGYYRDDWFMLWTGQAQGLAGIIKLFDTDRPFIGYVYALDYTLFGLSPLGWHIYALALKIAGVLAFFWLMRLVWPEKRLETSFAALLFALYPGFYQQPNGITFKNLLVSYDAYILSIALTVYLVQVRNRAAQVGLALLSVLLQAYALLIYESLLGVEIVRILLLWYVLHRRNPAILKQEILGAVKYLIPALTFAAGFLFWRVFIFKSVRHATDVNDLFSTYSGAPIHSILQIGINWVKDAFATVLFAWVVPIYNSSVNDRVGDYLKALGLGIVVAGLAGAYLWWYRRQRQEEPDENKPNLWLHFILLGIPCVLIPSLVIDLAGRQVIFGGRWDRYTYQSLAGIALLVTGFAFYALRGKLRWGFLFTLIVLSVMTQFESAMYYSNYWDYEKETMWQLAWRAPGLEPGTTLIVNQPDGYRLEEEYEVWGPANMVYSYGGPLYVSGQVMTDTLQVDLDKKTTEERDMRNVIVSRDYGQALIVSLSSPSSCVHIIDGRLPFYPSYESDQVKLIASYSQIGLILPNAPAKTPPVNVFGPEPAHTWCYYYQKINLALQAGDTASAVRLADETFKANLNPADTTEWMPILIAYANAGDAQKASQIVKQIKADRTVRDLLCLQIKQIKTWPEEYKSDLITSSLCGAKN